MLKQIRTALISCFFCLAVFSQAHAATIYTYGQDRDAPTPYTSSLAACTAYLSTIKDRGTMGPITSSWTGYNVEYSCGAQFTQKTPEGDNNYYGGTSIFRQGDSCPEGKTFDQPSGSCKGSDQKDGDTCEDQQGHGASNPIIFSSSAAACVALTDADDKATCAFFGGKGEQAYSVKGILSTGGDAVAPPTFAGQMGCEVATIQTSECTLDTKGAITCNVTAKFTGLVSTKTGPDVRDTACEGSSCGALEPTTSSTDKPCVMSGGSCTSETTTETQGEQGCGSFNGNYICTTVKPTSAGTKIDTTVKSDVQADGSVVTTKTDKGTKTTCKDVNSCTIKTSTTTTTTTTTKNGVATSTTSTCFGTCGSGGTGVGTGGGTGDGDGDGEEGDGKASHSEDCTVPPVCDGDVFLCSILRQEYFDSCAARKLPTDKEKADFQQIIDKKNADIATNQKEMDDKVTGLVSAFQASASGGGSSGGKCFEDKTISLPSAMGGRSFILPFSQVCPILEWFRYAMIAMAYLIALRIVSRDL